MLDKYFCQSCNKVHAANQTKEEEIFKTGFTFIQNEKLNVGRCDGYDTADSRLKEVQMA